MDGFVSGSGGVLSSRINEYYVSREDIGYSRREFERGQLKVDLDHFEEHYKVNYKSAIRQESIDCGGNDKILSVFRVKDDYGVFVNGGFEAFGFANILERWSRESCGHRGNNLPVETILLRRVWGSDRFETYLHSFHASAPDSPSHFVRSVEYARVIMSSWRNYEDWRFRQ